MPLFINDYDRQLLKEILGSKKHLFYVFGSRVKGNHKNFSDLDLCYKEDIADFELGELKDKLEDSNLSFKVDIINWKNCSTEFHNIIEGSMVRLDEIL